MGSVIVDKVVELCETIANDEQFKNFQQIVDTFIADENKNSEYQALLELQRDLHGKKHEGALTQDEIDAFEARCEEVFSQPAVSEFLEAQDALDQLSDLINRHVELTFEFGRVPTASELSEEREAERELHGHGGCGDEDCNCEEDCGDDCGCN